MNQNESDQERARLDDATSRRLAKLRNVPVDASALRKVVEDRIGRSVPVQLRSGTKWLTPLRAAAASVLLLGVIAALVITSSSGPVLASADRLAHVHEEVLNAEGSHVIPVGSAAAANAALAAEWKSAPSIPDLPDDHVVSCCIHTLGHKKMACVAFEWNGVPVTLAVAAAADVKVPDGKTLSVGGRHYTIQSQGDINIVMIKHGDRWVCLMGKLPQERLAELASTLRF